MPGPTHARRRATRMTTGPRPTGRAGRTPSRATRPLPSARTRRLRCSGRWPRARPRPPPEAPGGELSGDADTPRRGRVAFLFPGQGSQRVGMADGLRSTDPGLVAHHLRIAEQAWGLPIRRHCADDPIEELTRTEVSQPAILALSLALHEVARELWPGPAFVAGHSLGEYAAAVAAGSLHADDAMSLVVVRSRLMAAVQA